MRTMPIPPPEAATRPRTDLQDKTTRAAPKQGPKAAAWGAVPVALSLLVMLARRHHRLQPQHYTS